MNLELLRRFVRFGAVGIVGLLIDAGLVVALTQTLHLSPLPARLLSFLAAATATFVLNWRFTFRLNGKPTFEHLGTYWLATAIGAGINIGIYSIWIAITAGDALNLVVGTALGSGTAMVLNFAVSNRFVFRRESVSQ